MKMIFLDIMEYRPLTDGSVSECYTWKWTNDAMHIEDVTSEKAQILFKLIDEFKHLWV